MSKVNQFLKDRQVHLVLVTLAFAALAVADVALHALSTGAITLPPNVGLLVGPYIPILAYMVASYRDKLGTASTVQQQIAAATTSAATAVLPKGPDVPVGPTA